MVISMHYLHKGWVLFDSFPVVVSLLTFFMHHCNSFFFFFCNAAMNTDHAYGRIGFKLTSPREYFVLRKTCPALMV